MAVFDEPSGLTTAEVIRYLLKKGGKSTNHELVYQFKKFLNDPLRQVEARLEFKDIINTVATVWEEQGIKYIMLRKKYQDSTVVEEEAPSSLTSSTSSLSQGCVSSEYVSPYSQSFQPYWRYRLSSDRKLDPPAVLTGCRRLSQDSSENSSPPVSVVHAQSSPNLSETSSCDKIKHTETLEEPIYQNANSLLFQNYAANPVNSLKVRANSTQELVNNSAEYCRALPYFIGPDNCSPTIDAHCSEASISPQQCPPSRPMLPPKGYFKTDNLPMVTSSFPESQKPCSQYQKYEQQQLNVEHSIPNANIDTVMHQDGDDHQLFRQRNKVMPNSSTLSFTPEVRESVTLETPAPPPRQKESLGKENQKLEFSGSLNEWKDPIKVTPKDTELQQLNLSSGKVKERVQKLDQLSAQCNGKQGISPPTVRCRKREKNEKAYEDDASTTSVDPKLRRQWFLKAAICDYHSLVSLLKEQPHLANLKDMATGFTALHWAAKHGSSDVVKLIAGSHKINPNIKSHGGYTAIHIATLYKQKAVVDLLIKTYGADPTIRDHSGKRADQYPDGYVNRIAGVNRSIPTPTKRFEIPLNNKKIYVRPLDKEPSGTFIRIGSLNLKVARTSGVFSSMRSSTRLKTWSSADSVSDVWAGNSTNRSSVLKKKRSKKNSNAVQKSSATNHNDSDSDSAYGFHS